MKSLRNILAPATLALLFAAPISDAQPSQSPRPEGSASPPRTSRTNGDTPVPPGVTPGAPPVPQPGTGAPNQSPGQDATPSNPTPDNEARKPLLPTAGPNGPTASSQAKVSLQFPNNPVSDILAYYARWTGKKIIKDAQLAGVNLSIEVARPIPRDEAIALIEAALLLNGYAIIDAGPDTVKVINTTGKSPRSEGVTLYADPSVLPSGEVVVSYFMPLRYISPDDAMGIFQSHVQMHAYGSMVPVENAQAVLLTENASLVRKLIELKELIDVPPAQVTTEFIQLQRADAERVAELITQLLEARSQPSTPRRPSTPPGNAPKPPAPTRVSTGTGSGEASLIIGEAQILADPRTNSIVLVTRPLNVPYLRNLILEFDRAVTLSDAYVHRLNYINAGEVLTVLADVIAKGEEEEVGTGTRQTRPRQTTQGRPTRASEAFRGAQRTGTGSGSAISRSDVLSEPTDNPIPESVIVGNTTIIADNKSNSILVMGPPEAKDKVRDMLDKLDRRPLQVFLSTVIGLLNIGDDRRFAVDAVQKYTGDETKGIAGLLRTRDGEELLELEDLIDIEDLPLAPGLTVFAKLARNLDVYVRALENSNRFKVISRPTLYTANNKKAVILSGERVAVPTQTLSNITNDLTNAVTSNISFEDIVLKLEVIPLINPNREVTLEINQLNERIIGTTVISGNEVPDIGTQEITTTITVPDGSTILLGGLVTETRERTQSSFIPWLGRVPIIGYFVSNTKKDIQRQELVVMIQPTVVEYTSEAVQTSYDEQSRIEIGHELRRDELATGPPESIKTPEDTNFGPWPVAEPVYPWDKPPGR